MDWDNDGDLDLVTGESNGRIRVYRNSAATGVPVLGAPVTLRVGASTFQPAAGFSKPEVVDWNNDGLIDIVCGDGDGQIHLLLNTGTASSPAFASSSIIRAGGSPLWVGDRASPVVVDWNGDGRKDLIVGTAEGRLTCFLNTGTNAAPTFGAAGEAMQAGGNFIDVGYYARPEVVDWNNDGALDLICGFEDYQSPAQALYLFRAITPLSVSIGDTSVTEGTGGTVNATFTVTLSAPATQTVSVRYSTSNGSAEGGSDFSQVAGTLTFSAGQRIRTFNVPIVADAFLEGDEDFLVNLSLPSNVTIADGQGICEILDDDTPPTISIDDASAVEGDVGSTDALFAVRLSAAWSQPVTVQYRTVNGTAISAVDYTATSGILTFNPGETVKVIAVPVLGDMSQEATENFLVELAAPANATLADAEATGTITDDDAPRLSILDATASESDGSVVVSITLSAASGTPVTVSYATENAGATAGSDYTARGGTVTFDPGMTSMQVTIPLLGDGLDEAAETFRLVLSNATGATIARAQSTVTLEDNDPSPTLSIDDVLVAEGHTGTTSATFTVHLSAASGRTVTVAYATAGGTATPDVDYTTAGGTVSIAPGQTSATFTVPVRTDTTLEADETFGVVLSDPLNATLADGEATGTIQNDDASGSPEVKVLLKLQEIRDGQSTIVNFGTVRKGAKGPTRTFLVQNIGQATLGLGTVRLPRGFSLVNGLVPQLAPGQSDTFAVRLQTTTVATRSGQLRFATTDADENPFNFPIKGVVTAARNTRVRARALAASPLAPVIAQSRPEYQGVFALVRSPALELEA